MRVIYTVAVTIEPGAELRLVEVEATDNVNACWRAMKRLSAEQPDQMVSGSFRVVGRRPAQPNTGGG